jgi:hypothetical protein
MELHKLSAGRVASSYCISSINGTSIIAGFIRGAQSSAPARPTNRGALGKTGDGDVRGRCAFDDCGNDAGRQKGEGSEQADVLFALTAILGIDTGAVAQLSADGSLLPVDDIPVLRDGPKNRARVTAPLLAEVIFKSHATLPGDY